MSKFKQRKKTDYIVVHCAATSPSMDIGREEMARWHKNQGWLDVGYHLIVRRDGRVEAGRPLDTVGSHARLYNSRSVSVCLIGGVEEDKTTPSDNFTQSQYRNLLYTLGFLKQLYPEAQVVTHNYLDPRRACPSFSQDQLEEAFLNFCKYHSFSHLITDN